MNPLHRNLSAILMALLLAGCAATPPPVTPPPVAPPPVTTEPAPTQAPTVRERQPAALPAADLVLFDEGVALLRNRERPDPARAREVFTALLTRHPQSRWRPAAETYIQMIDAGDALREASVKGQLLTEKLLAERGRLMQENDLLKKNVRELAERLQTEAGLLTQENEKLRQDLQRLKTLEIELEKRERMLR
jgi:hypothetical protein